MIELTREQGKQLKGANGATVRAVDPDTKQQYVLLRVETYQRMRELLETEILDPSLYEFEDTESTPT